jgi:hypothetical protein
MLQAPGDHTASSLFSCLYGYRLYQAPVKLKLEMPINHSASRHQSMGLALRLFGFRNCIRGVTQGKPTDWLDNSLRFYLLS